MEEEGKMEEDITKEREKEGHGGKEENNLRREKGKDRKIKHMTERRP